MDGESAEKKDGLR